MIRFRSNIECEFWAEMYARAWLPGNADVATPVADRAVVQMRIRQGTIRLVGRTKESFQPVGYQVCAVCEGRTAHAPDCENCELELPVILDLPVIE